MHTSDWHLGKKLLGIDRSEEQRAVLAEISNIAREKNVDLIIIAGDVFDTYTPSAESEELFFETISELSKYSKLAIIAGNHDDPVRLCASKSLAASKGILLLGEGAECIDIKIKDESITLGALPYPSDSRMGTEIQKDSTYTDRVREWLMEASKNFENGRPSVLVSHLFCSGAVKDGDERDIELGTAKIIPLDAFLPCSYVALGHIHKAQCLSKERNIYYSGSIMQYSFAESKSEKSVNIVDISDKVFVEVVPLTSAKPLKRLAAKSVEEAEKLLAEYGDYLIELTLKTDSRLSGAESKRLKNTYKNLALFKLELPESVREKAAGRTEKSHLEIFNSFLLKRGEKPDEKLGRLFMEIMAEVEKHE